MTLPRWALTAFFLTILSAAPAAAALSPTSLDTIVQLYQTQAQNWQSTLVNYATTLFWLLATIELTYTGIRLTLKAADAAEWASELVNQILFIGFFFALLQNSSTWAAAIVNSFRTAANQAVTASGGQALHCTFGHFRNRPQPRQQAARSNKHIQSPIQRRTYTLRDRTSGLLRSHRRLPYPGAC